MDIIETDNDLEHGKNVAVMAYLWIPGWILALILNGMRRTQLASFHLRQALGIWILSFLFLIKWFRWGILALVVLLCIVGIMKAFQKKREP